MRWKLCIFSKFDYIGVSIIYYLVSSIITSLSSLRFRPTEAEAGAGISSSLCKKRNGLVGGDVCYWKTSRRRNVDAQNDCHATQETIACLRQPGMTDPC